MKKVKDDENNLFLSTKPETGRMHKDVASSKYCSRGCSDCNSSRAVTKGDRKNCFTANTPPKGVGGKLKKMRCKRE